MKSIVELLRLFKPYYKWMVAGIFLSITVILTNIGLLALSGWFITSMAIAGITTGAINYFTPAAGIRGFAILRTLSRYLERLISHEATFRMLSSLRVWFYEHLEPLAPAQTQFLRSGDLLSRMRSDIDTLDNFYLHTLGPSIAALITIVLMIIFLYTINGKAAWIDLAGLLSAGLILPLLSKKIADVPGNQIIEQRSILRSDLSETVTGLGELRIYGGETRQFEKLIQANDELISAERKQAQISGGNSALVSLIAQITIFFILVEMIPTVLMKNLSGPDFTMIVMFVMASFESVNGLPNAYQQLGETITASKRVFEIAHRSPVVTEPELIIPNPTTHSLSFSQVKMRYTESSEWSLNNISFQLNQGEKLGIVGPTGSGKSTILQLLLRFWDFQEGVICIGNTPIRSLRSEVIREMYAVVSQDTHLFNTTIRQNLLLAKPSATDEELWKALQEANIDQEILSLPSKLDTFVGETGTFFSGGQIRRIAIARAFLKNAPIMLLDEPTEGLDAESEFAVLQSLKRLLEKRTAIIITHRPQALWYVDQIAILDQGQLIDHGPSNVMMDSNTTLQNYIRLI